MSEHFFWITSRAAGVAALLASSAAVTMGLLMGGRLVKGRLAQDLTGSRTRRCRSRRLPRCSCTRSRCSATAT